ncbi:NAD(P)-dependent oxidoreductase [Jiangella gansuensis]|uniref:NAD(P)-dependent oxidoreductase n=1 Tax=Jiangella gansuensis TaxID=281473 RepID=UPI000478936F|nr:NAD(P)-dependent oxidoreductase [Jiangella gansuensis]
MSTSTFRIGWIGTGLMGMPMVRHVVAGGHDVRAFVRTAGRSDALAAAGAKPAGTVADTVRDADVVVTIVSAPADVEQVYLSEDGVLANAAAGTVVIDMTTSAPALARRLAEAGAERGVTVLDAPVSGGPAGAQAGTLSVMVGGDADGLRRVRPVLDIFAGTVVHQGPAGSGQLAKLVNQTLVAGVTLAACEAFVLASSGGLDLERVSESVRPGVAGSPLFDFVWSRLRAGDLEPGFKLDHLRKDLGLVIEAAGDTELPGTTLVTELVDTVRQQRGGDRGTQALATAITEWPA